MSSNNMPNCHVGAKYVSYEVLKPMTSIEASVVDVWHVQF